MSTARDILTPHQVADELGRHYETVLRHIKAGLLRATKQGGRIYIRRAWLNEYIDLSSRDRVA